MKLAFTTLGCPMWDLATAVKRGRDYGYDGIDIRTLQGTNQILALDDFGADLSRSVARVEKSDLELTCFSSSIEGFAEGEILQNHTKELEGYLELCRAFGTKMVRIFGGTIGDTPRGKALELVIENCRRYVELSAQDGVTLLIETHDSWTKSQYVKQIVEAVDSEHLRVVWDVAHPYRHSGESPQETWDCLGPWIKNTHWKDSFPAKPTEETNRDFRLCLLGEGELPLPDFFRVLKAAGYDGYFTLEWEKMWHGYLEEPEIAFPHYVQYMKNLEEE